MSNKNIEIVCVCVSEITAPGRNPFVTVSKLNFLLECHELCVVTDTIHNLSS